MSKFRADISNLSLQFVSSTPENAIVDLFKEIGKRIKIFVEVGDNIFLPPKIAEQALSLLNIIADGYFLVIYNINEQDYHYVAVPANRFVDNGDGFKHQITKSIEMFSLNIPHGRRETFVLPKNSFLYIDGAWKLARSSSDYSYLDFGY